MTTPTPRDSAQLPPLRKLTEDELSTLHDNPNTSDVKQLVYDYAREALRAQAASVPVGTYNGSSYEAVAALISDLDGLDQGTKLYAGAPPTHIPAYVPESLEAYSRHLDAATAVDAEWFAERHSAIKTHHTHHFGDGVSRTLHPDCISDALKQGFERGFAALQASHQPVAQQGGGEVDELRRAVKAMTAMLVNGEWAEHVSNDPDASGLESAITALHDEAGERFDALEKIKTLYDREMNHRYNADMMIRAHEIAALATKEQRS